MEQQRSWEVDELLELLAAILKRLLSEEKLKPTAAYSGRRSASIPRGRTRQ